LDIKESDMAKKYGKKVTSRKQAIAIGLSQARAAGGKVPPPKKPSARRASSHAS